MEICNRCGAHLQDAARFCSSCGAPVGAAGRGSLGGGFFGLGLSADLRQRILTDVEGEHRLVTVVFADLTSSVSRMRDLHAEEAAKLVSGLLETMVEVLLRYGGRIDRFLGDGVLSVFGIPETHEDDPERAVRAALEIRERAEELGLNITAGINTGRVYFGPVGSSLHEELTVMGAVVNLAARLQAVAKRGQVLIGEATRARVYAAFDLRPVLVDVKGIEEPVEAYSAERLLDHPDKVRGIEGLGAELVGREKELARLETAAAEAGGRFLALVGEAGVGKSRLASEFRASFVGKGGRWLEGRCHALTRLTGYGPIRDLLSRSFSGPASSVRGLGDLRDSVDGLISAGRLPQDWTQEAGPFLLALLAQDPKDPRVEQATPEQRKAMTATAIGDYLEALSVDRPLVMFIEDLHWVDELTVGVLLHLMSRLRESSVLLMGSYRADPGSQGPTLESRALADPSLVFEKLPVGELGPEDVRRLVESLLDARTLPDWMEGLIFDRAEGNPLYLEELIRSLIQKGALRREGPEWRFEAGPAEPEIPDSIQSLILSRVDRLDRHARRCAQIASVLGRTFDQALLEQIAGRAMGGELRVLTEAGIIHPEGLPPLTVYGFGHGLSQESLYETVLPSRRSEIHGLAARTLEARSSDDVDTLSYHYERSRDHGKAVQYLLAAGEKAMASFLTDSALEYLQRGLKRSQDLGGEEDREEWMARFRARRGEMLERLGRHEEARSELLLSLGLGVHDVLEEARLHRLVGQTHRLEGSFAEANASYDRAEKALDASPLRSSTPYQRAWIEIQKERAFSLYFGGRAQDLPAHNVRTGPVVERYGSGPQQIDHIIGGLLNSFRKHRFLIPPQVVSEARKALAMATASSDLGRTAEVRFVLGFALLWADQVEDSETWLSRALNDARRIGDAVLENRAVAYHATCLRRLGRLDDALASSSSALATARALDDRKYEGHALANLCWTRWRGGLYDEAKELGSQAYASWGKKDGVGGRGLDTEFAFLAVWPLVAVAMEVGGLDEARGHLGYLASPWERAMAPDLSAKMEVARSEGATRKDLSEALRLARNYNLA